MVKTANITIRTQKLLLAVSVVLFGIKVLAWFLTGSVAILTDALESTVNVIAGVIGLYSVILASKPKDTDHPYGHGKVEFLSSALEGILIAVAGLIIIYESLDNLLHPHGLRSLDIGLVLIAFTGAVNYMTGLYCIRKGRKENSPVLIAGGKHLISDTYSTLGIVLGLILIMLTGIKWIDSVAAMVFACLIIITGYKIIRRSVSGIMDESDTAVISEIIEVLTKNRREEWIDVHNMRVINYAGFYHIDCHLTLPFYITVEQGHSIQEAMADVLKAHFKEKAEFFIHIDPCVSAQCSICSLKDCRERKTGFGAQIIWNADNVLLNSKHGIK